MATPLCFITVDTEEDEWGAYHLREGSVRNIEALPEFQSLCEGVGAIPTYLVNWPVVQADRSRQILHNLQAGGRCEIGTHCHPWNTPPFEEVTGPRNSWLRNLDRDLVRRKLTTLHTAIGDQLGVRPTTFRTGRWGFGRHVAHALQSLGYSLDSSVSPWVDWSGSGGPDYSSRSLAVYRFTPESPMVSTPAGSLLEVPATIAFYQRRQELAGRMHRVVRRGLSHLRLLDAENMPWGAPGLEQLGLANIRWLSPEQCDAREMIRLARTLLDAGYQWLNVPLHSVTLLPGATPFVRTEADRTRFLDTLRQFLEFARDAGVQFAPLSAAAQITPPGYTTP